MKTVKYAIVLMIIAISGIFEAQAATKILFLCSDNDSNMMNKAADGMKLPRDIQLEYLLQNSGKTVDIPAKIKEADIIIVNCLVEEFREYIYSLVDFARTKVYALSAVRLKGKYPVIDSAEVAKYRLCRNPENFRNMIYYIINKECDSSVKYEKPLKLPDIGICHTATEEIFPDLESFLKWYKASGKYRSAEPLVAVTIYAATFTEEDMQALRPLVNALEQMNLNTFIAFGDEPELIKKVFIDDKGDARVDAVLGLSFKFKSGLRKELIEALEKLGVPVINGLKLSRQYTHEWRESAKGMNDFSVSFSLIAPEMSGLIEPSLLYGKTKKLDPDTNKEYYVSEPFEENIRNTAARIRKWAMLRKKNNADKRIAIIIYNHEGGKQGVGASYMNVPRSLSSIITAMGDAGYKLGSLGGTDEKSITGMILQNARNVGSWAPGELDNLLASRQVVRLPVKLYKKWFDELPEHFKENVIRQWGEVENSKIMVKDGNLIIPMLGDGNIVILPEPMRGWLDDPYKIYHSTELYPHHQYVAAYLWLKHEFNADAMIHLGRHATHEWLPGKQTGLSHECPPAVLLTDIPNIYPYIVDGIGEGIQAKRRAAAVIIDHLTPVLSEAGVAPELVSLQEKISSYQSSDPALLESKFAEIRDAVSNTGLDKELKITDFSKESIDLVDDYIDQLKSSAMPYGLHSFGLSPTGKGLDDMTALILKNNPSMSAEKIRELLARSGGNETSNLLAALSGKYIPGGESGDPVRNPDCLPTGRNFYGFDPDKIPTQSAYKIAEKTVQELLKSKLEKDKKYPEKIAIVLWAGETLRNEGVNESIILNLIGMTPEWDANGRVTGVKLIPGNILERPRIDVMITSSGAYRDQFGNILKMLDKAAKFASKQTDIENFLSQNAKKAEASLVAEGYSAEEASVIAANRVFTPAPSSYGVGIKRLAGSSGIWEKDDELLKVYLLNMNHTLGEDGNYVKAEKSVESNLKSVDTVMHSRSSNLYGVTDIDDMFQYLGGLSMAARKLSGKTPDSYISNQRKAGDAKWEKLDDFIAKELRSRMFNPRWIEAMKKENYSGAKTISRNTDNLWGWQTVTPENISEAQWNSLFDVYVKDKYQLGLKEFFNNENPWAYQSMTARMLEAVRKDYWKADISIQKSLGVEYAMSVISKGVACCDHTCNNPLLHQMVVSIISMPGVMSPDLVMKFKMAVEQAGGKDLGQQVSDRKNLQAKIAASLGNKKKADDNRKDEGKKDSASRDEAKEKADSKPVKGFKLVEKNKADETTELSSSGIRWVAVAMVLVLLLLFAIGFQRKVK